MSQLSLLAPYDANRTTPPTIRVGDKVHNHRGQVGFVAVVDSNNEGPVYVVALIDTGVTAVWLHREIKVHIVRSKGVR